MRTESRLKRGPSSERYSSDELRKAFRNFRIELSMPTETELRTAFRKTPGPAQCKIL